MKGTTRNPKQTIKLPYVELKFPKTKARTQSCFPKQRVFGEFYFAQRVIITWEIKVNGDVRRRRNETVVYLRAILVEIHKEASCMIRVRLAVCAVHGVRFRC